MPNVHLKEAANNIRKAVNDVRLLQQETQVQTNDQVHQMEARVKAIDLEKKDLQRQLVREQDNSSRVQHMVLVKKLNDEQSQLQKSINDLHAQAQRQVQDLDKQVYDFESLAGRLEMMA